MREMCSGLCRRFRGPEPARRSGIGLAMAVMLGFLWSVQAEAISFTLTKVTDTAALALSPFSGLGAPALEDGDLAFRSFGSGVFAFIDAGVYVKTGSGPVNKVIGVGTTIPGGSGGFTSFLDPGLHSGAIAFHGFGSGQEGIYTNFGGPLHAVADKNMVNPGGFQRFVRFGDPIAFKGGSIAYHGTAESVVGSFVETGIFRAFGGLPTVTNVVARTPTAYPPPLAIPGTPIPGGVESSRSSTPLDSTGWPVRFVGPISTTANRGSTWTSPAPSPPWRIRTPLSRAGWGTSHPSSVPSWWTASTWSSGPPGGEIGDLRQDRGSAPAPVEHEPRVL